MPQVVRLIWTDTQWAILQAQALAEGRTISSIIRGATMQYLSCNRHFVEPNPNKEIRRVNLEFINRQGKDL